MLWLPLPLINVTSTENYGLDIIEKAMTDNDRLVFVFLKLYNYTYANNVGTTNRLKDKNEVRFKL